MSADTVNRNEIMVLAAAREIDDHAVCFIGTGLPMIAAYLAKATHAPNAVLLFESGIIDAEPRHLATGVGDFTLLAGCAKAGGLFYALSLLQAGRIDVGFLGAAEVDPYGNINSTAIGDYRRPKVRLPGSGGANDIGSMARRTLLIIPHERRKFVERLSYMTTPGHLTGPGARQKAGLTGGGPARVITDKAVLGFDPATLRMRLESVHPGVTLQEVLDSTGFELLLPEAVPVTPGPTPQQVALIRSLDPDGVYLD